ncbi:MAG: phosphotransferase [Pseudomonadota bacterium]|nr:phosphotransferase [Pseudomonadota bacterium]
MSPGDRTSTIPDDPGALTSLVARALECWGLPGAKTEVSLVTRRENIVYRVTVTDSDRGHLTDFALRLHRPGLRTAPQLRSELAWMQAMAEAGVPVPAPRLSRSGALIETVDGLNFSLLDWIDAEPLGRESGILQRAGAEATMVELGRQIALLHREAAAWTPPAGFDRPVWDFEGLLGEHPLWGRFWDRPELSAEQADLLARARDRGAEQLAAMAPPLRLIHGDLIPDNVLIGVDGGLHLIDFDDSCWSFREFELATTISRLERSPDPEPLIEALLAGYEALEPIDSQALPLVLALRHFTYVGWISDRIGEPGAPDRARRLIAAACTHAERLLQS